MVLAVTSTLSLYYSQEEGGVMMERLPEYLLTLATALHWENNNSSTLYWKLTVLFCHFLINVVVVTRDNIWPRPDPNHTGIDTEHHRAAQSWYRYKPQYVNVTAPPPHLFRQTLYCFPGGFRFVYYLFFLPAPHTTSLNTRSSRSSNNSNTISRVQPRYRPRAPPRAETIASN